ncbi:MAG: sodium-dependent transporter [Bacteroidetes bacterium]|nr:sodium-dependent transporter [Bacteroidota bacterium]
MALATSDRGSWSSRTGFILAAAGSAVGLGNIWRFPYTAGENGGGAWVLIYLVFVLLIGIPVLLAELSIGRKTKLNPVGSFEALTKSKFWPWVGGLGVLTGFGILAFYAVVAGWTLAYVYEAVTGAFAGSISAEQSSAIFSNIISNPGLAILLTGLFLLLTILVVRGGVSKGIEKTTKVLMPLLVIILVILAFRSVTLPGGMAGLSYLFAPDFSKLTGTGIMTALGQALFSLSLGMGAMITYGSYFPDDANLPASGVQVAFFDTAIAVLAGIIIFPALFSAGVAPDGGAGLVFVVLPTIFGSLPAGNLFAIAFYALLAIAALTSTISLLEVCVSYFVDNRGWSREKAAWILGAVCFGLAIPSALANGASPFFSDFLGSGFDFLTIQNNLWGNFSLTIGAILICVFVGWIWGVDKALGSIESSGHSMAGKALFRILIRFVCPAAILAVLIFIVITGNFF